MTEDVNATREPRGPRSDRARIALAALGGGLAVVLIGAGAVAVSGMASADTATPTPTTSAGATDGSGHGPGPMGGRFGGFGAMGPLGEVLHGTAVAKDEDGDLVSYEAQRGSVTAVSASSISVKSEDGYEHTYEVNDATEVNRDGAISDIATGDEVVVIATQDGGTSTATRIVNLAELQQRMDDMMQRFEDRADGSIPPPMRWHHGEGGAPQGSGGSGTGDGTGSSSPAPTPSTSSTT